MNIQAIFLFLIIDLTTGIETIYYFKPFELEKTSNNLEMEESENLTCEHLEVDKSCFILKSEAEHKIKFLYQSLECEKCLFIELEPLRPSHWKKVVFDFSSLGTAWKVVTENNKTICSNSSYLGENSWYSLYINNTDCLLVTDKPPDNVYIPIFIAIGIYFLIALMWIIGKNLYRKEIFNNLFSRNTMDELTAAAFSSSSTIEDKTQARARQRLRSLDTVRGIAIVLMIFVNYGGGKYWFFHHARWNGLTFADLVFPWFIWMMGMSMALSIRSQLRKAIPQSKIFLKIVKRSIILFALGLILNTYCQVIALENLRIPGVLQRFSISYFIVATVHLLHAKPEDVTVLPPWSSIRDIILYWGEWIIMLSLLAAHLLLTFLIHDSNCPRGYLGPGGMHDYGKYELCTGGAAGYIDRIVLGDNHIYQNPSSRAIYHSTIPHDPEGILGMFTSIFLVFLGLQAGKILLTYKEWKSRIIRWISWSILTGAIAAILCCCSKNDGWIPVNKNLWSISFIMATGSMAFMLISICYYVIDVKNIWTGAPFYYSGMNSIMLYIGHELTHKMFPWKWQVQSNHMDLLFVDLWGTSLWVIISIWMFYKEIFITI